MHRLFLLFCVLFFLPLVSASLLDDIELYYKLDETSGTTAQDATGNGNDGTLSGDLIINQTGIINTGAGSFGTLQRGLDTTHKPQLNSFSVGFWFKTNDSSSNQILLDGGNWFSLTNGFFLFALSNNTYTFGLREGANVKQIYGGSFSDDAWNNVVFFSNSTHFGLYQNAVLIEQTTHSFTQQMSNDLRFACRFTSPFTQCLQGNIDEVGVWSRKLNNQEIEELYNLGLGIQYPFEFSDFFSINAQNNGNPVFSFNATITTPQNGTQNFQTTNGTIITDINKTLGYIAQINLFSEGFIPLSISNYDTSNNLIANFLVDNQIIFNFRDEQTNQPVLDINYTVISPLFSVQNSTSNGQLALTNLPQGAYELRYDSEDYNPRSTFFFIPIAQNLEINRTLYLLNITEGDFYLPIILDENENVVPDSYFQALRWYVGANNTGEYRVVETSRIDSQGRATMFLEFNTVGYTFRLLQNTTLLQSFPQPKFLFAQTEFYRFSVGSQLISSYKDLGNIQIDLSFIQSVDDFFQLQFNDPNNFASEVCLYVTFNGFGTNGTIDQITKTCSVASSSTITQIVNLTNAGVFRAWAEVTAQVDGTKYELANIVFDNRQAQGFAVLGGFGLFLLFIILSVGVLLTIFAPIVGLGMIVLTLLAFSPALLGIVPLNPVWIGGLVVILFILGFLFARRETN